MEKATESKLRRRRSREEIKELLQSYRESGHSQKQWAQNHGVSVASLGYWLRREREEGTGFGLVPIQVESCEGRALEVEVEGMRLRFGAGSDLRVVAALLKELG